MPLVVSGIIVVVDKIIPRHEVCLRQVRETLLHAGIIDGDNHTCTGGQRPGILHADPGHMPLIWTVVWIIRHPTGVCVGVLFGIQHSILFCQFL